MANETFGPVDLTVAVIPDSGVDEAIVSALASAVEQGDMRIIDLVVISKDPDGSVAIIDISEDDELFQALEGEIGELLTDEDIEMVAELLEPGATALAVLWEHAWAKGLAGALRDADAQILLHERIPDEAVQAALATIGDS